MSVSEYLLCLNLFSNILVSAIHSAVLIIVDIIKHIDVTKLPCLQNIYLMLAIPTMLCATCLHRS